MCCSFEKKCKNSPKTSLGYSTPLKARHTVSSCTVPHVSNAMASLYLLDLSILGGFRISAGKAVVNITCDQGLIQDAKSICEYIFRLVRQNENSLQFLNFFSILFLQFSCIYKLD